MSHRCVDAWVFDTGVAYLANGTTLVKVFTALLLVLLIMGLQTLPKSYILVYHFLTLLLLKYIAYYFPAIVMNSLSRFTDWMENLPAIGAWCVLLSDASNTHLTRIVKIIYIYTFILNLTNCDVYQSLWPCQLPAQSLSAMIVLMVLSLIVR